MEGLFGKAVFSLFIKIKIIVSKISNQLFTFRFSS